MKSKITLILLALVAMVVLVLGTGGMVSANSPASSTMWFQGTLTAGSGGVYTGVLPMVDEDAAGIGDNVSGYDIYAKHGELAWFGELLGPPVWTSQLISSHDAWPTWNPNTPDWYQYSLNLYIDGGQAKWAVRNHPGATAAHPWDDVAHWGSPKPPAGVPMSGTMNWTTMMAAETDVGAYLPGTGTPAIPDGAASKGGGAGAWDMDWSWGSEMVPLEFPQFKVAVEDLGSGNYRVSLTPSGVRDADSYKIHFEWSQGCPNVGEPGGSLFQDDGYLILTAARTSRAFNVYAKNNSPGVETDCVEDHSAWPNWYETYGWDTPDADPVWNCAVAYECPAPFYLLTIDTYQGKWWLFYTQYPNQPSTAGVANLYVPMSGVIDKVTFNDDDTIDIEIEEDGQNWKSFWVPDAFEDVKLQDKHFVIHLNPATMSGYIAPKQLLP